MTNIEKLLANGGNRWTKNGMDRIYMNAEHLGLNGTMFNGQKISKSMARDLANAKTYYDIQAQRIVSTSATLAAAMADLLDVEYSYGVNEINAPESIEETIEETAEATAEETKEEDKTMKKYEAHITVDSFGADLPANWEAAADLLNEKIDALAEDEFGNIDEEEVNEIWENYCAGDYDDEIEPVKVTKFELRTKDAEFKNRNEIHEGCAFDTEDESTLIATFETKAEALEALADYESDVGQSGSIHGGWLVTEYWVEEVDYTIAGDGSVTDRDFVGTVAFAPGLTAEG